MKEFILKEIILEVFMEITWIVILLLLISIYTTARDVNLFTNTNFLLLLLLAITGNLHFGRRENHDECHHHDECCEFERRRRFI